MLTTPEVRPPFLGLSDALERLIRPAIGYQRPSDVLKDVDLSIEEKRAILSSWASDACAVEDKPQLRWLIGSPAPVPLSEVREALLQLDYRAYPPSLEAASADPKFFSPNG